MSDAALRSAERQGERTERQVVERLRAGRLDRRAVELAAWLGDPVACGALGVERVRLSTGRVEIDWRKLSPDCMAFVAQSLGKAMLLKWEWECPSSLRRTYEGYNGTRDMGFSSPRKLWEETKLPASRRRYLDRLFDNCGGNAHAAITEGAERAGLAAFSLRAASFVLLKIKDGGGRHVETARGAEDAFKRAASSLGSWQALADLLASAAWSWEPTPLLP